MAISVGKRPAGAKRGRRATVDAETVRAIVTALKQPSMQKDSQEFVMSDEPFETVKDARNEAAKYKRFISENSLVDFPLSTSAWQVDGEPAYWGIRPGKEKAETPKKGK